MITDLQYDVRLWNVIHPQSSYKYCTGRENTQSLLMEMDAGNLEPLIDSESEIHEDEELEHASVVTQTGCKGPISWHKENAPIEIVVFLFVFGSALAMPAVQFYSINYINGQHSNHSKAPGVSVACKHGHTGNLTDDGFAEQKDAEKEKAQLFMYFSLATSFCAIVPTLLSGSLSDSFGRKPFLIILLAAGVLQYFSWICVMHFKLPVGYFMIGYAIEGIAGSYGVAFMTLMCVVADVTTPGKQRAFRMIVADAAAAIGFGGAGVLTGFWINNNSNYTYPVIAAVAANTIALVYLLALIPETLHKQNGRDCSFKLKKCFKFLKVYSDNSEPNRRGILAVSLVCILLTAMYFKAPLTLYLQNTPFCWGALGITSFIAVGLASQIVISMPSVKLMQTFLKFDEVTIAVIGCVCAIASNITFGVAGYLQWLIFLSIPLGCMQYVIIPMIRSIMSTQVSKDDQGGMFAGIACAETVTGVVATIVCNEVYSLTLSVYDGLIYFILAGCEILVMLLLLMMAGRIRKRRLVTFTSIQ